MTRTVSTVMHFCAKCIPAVFFIACSSSPRTGTRTEPERTGEVIAGPNGSEAEPPEIGWDTLTLESQRYVFDGVTDLAWAAYTNDMIGLHQTLVLRVERGREVVAEVVFEGYNRPMQEEEDLLLTTGHRVESYVRTANGIAVVVLTWNRDSQATSYSRTAYIFDNANHIAACVEETPGPEDGLRAFEAQVEAAVSD